MKHILFLLFACLSLFSCIDIKNRAANEIKTGIEKPEPVHDPFDNKEWQAELDKDKGKLKAGWLSWWNPYDFADDEHMEGFHVIRHSDNTAVMWILPVMNYLIRYKPFMKWNGNDSIESLMELSKTTVSGLIVKGDTIIGSVDYERNDTTWKATGWGPLDKKIAATLSNLVLKKKERVIMINLEGSDEPKTYLRQYLVYKENGEYMHSLSGGGSSRLIDDFIEGQRNNKAGAIW